MQEGQFCIYQDVFGSTITPENVNCIPQDWHSQGYWADHLQWKLDLCKTNYFGFITLLVMGDFWQGTDLLKTFLNKWHTFIDWPRAAKSGVGPDNLIGCQIINWPSRTPDLINHGCPVTKDDFRWFARRLTQRDQGQNPIYEDLAEFFFEHVAGDCDWTQGPPWLDEICRKYQVRRDACQTAVMAVLGSKSKQCSRDVLGLIAREVWNTRYKECWVTPFL